MHQRTTWPLENDNGEGANGAPNEGKLSHEGGGGAQRATKAAYFVRSNSIFTGRASRPIRTRTSFSGCTAGQEGKIVISIQFDG